MRRDFKRKCPTYRTTTSNSLHPYKARRELISIQMAELSESLGRPIAGLSRNLDNRGQKLKGAVIPTTPIAIQWWKQTDALAVRDLHRPHYQRGRHLPREEFIQ